MLQNSASKSETGSLLRISDGISESGSGSGSGSGSSGATARYCTLPETETEKQKQRNSGQRDIRFLFLVWSASWSPCVAPTARQDTFFSGGALKPFHSIGQKKC